ncbi:sulfurtransferase TusA family protein [Aquabacter sp. L1I39]|uniref:sulfurtransferase TusA family protein n=1 Tax=Aquabacter sp. L1I39 TaxID=2820278 RepID=UPI001ADD5D10|nr:sulfurtransferase TusA family protein [Aquabacter sp. L1I39]QTL02638.1 sulfurtransferase TusA family protein [Aquabacter sp. L1I39]
MAEPSPVLDLRGLKCPLPVLRTRKALAALSAGARLTVLCTDPMSAIDIPHLMHETGNEVEGREVTDGVLTFRLRKAEGC